MSKLIALVGDTGCGKSHSIQFLDPKETYIISVADKELPFKGSTKLYNRDSKNYKHVKDAAEVLRLLNTLSNDAPQIKTVIIEDGNYIMGFNLVDKATEGGYTKFSVMAQQMVSLIQGAKKLRDDMVVVYISHQEELEDSGEIVSYKMKTAGKMIDNQIKLEGLFTVVIYAITETKGDKTDYLFITNKYKKYPAKSPAGMFSELKIPNNLKTVVDNINDYYN
jgi:ABC-type dipeptide/oligopeptide/nickel transport system ATPase component